MAIASSDGDTVNPPLASSGGPAVARVYDILRDAQALNTLVLASSRDWFALLDLGERTVFVSPGGLQALEIPDAASVVGHSWLRHWRGRDIEAAKTAIREARAGRTGRFQAFCPTHLGTPKWWDVVISPLPGAGGGTELLVSFARDITELKLTEFRLALSEQRARTLTETLPQLVWTCRPDGSCDYLSRQWVEYTGIPEADQLGLNWLDRAIHPDDRQRVYKHWMDAVAGLQPYDVDFRIRAAGGSYRWFKTRGTAIRAEDGAIVQWFGTCTDIQDIVEAREVLARSRADLERQVEARTRERDRAWKYSRDLQAVIDSNGAIRAANDSWSSILGWPPAEVLGQCYSEFVHPEDRAIAKAGMELAGRSDLPNLELRCLHRDGGWRWISWVAAPEGGMIYASGRHVSAEREASAALEAAQEQLRQSQKMEAVGQLTGGLAHDFNNLLTGVMGNLDLLQQRLAEGRVEEADRYITAAQGAAKRASALTHRLLAFSRRQTLDPKPTSVTRLVTGMEDLIRRTMGPSIETEVVIAEDFWNACVDQNQLENALLNLCINARDAMPDGGVLRIAGSNRRIDEAAARARDLPSGEYLALEVGDTGTGMTPEVKGRAFDPFFTTKPIGTGTGLGLSMIYGFVRQSGGQVRIESEIGRGTSVQIILPRHDGAAEIDAEVPDMILTTRAAGDETVLVVDDEPVVRMLIVEVLQGMGYCALEAEDGAGAMSILHSSPRIDLLVTDVGLPGGMNGRQLADAGRMLRPGMQVLFITGYADEASPDGDPLEPGMQVLTKPFAMDALAARISAMIAGAK